MHPSIPSWAEQPIAYSLVQHQSFQLYMVGLFFMSSSLCPSMINAWENWELTQIYKKLKVFNKKICLFKEHLYMMAVNSDSLTKT